MRWVNRTLLVLLVVVLVPLGLLALSLAWFELNQHRFYAERPVLKAMHAAHDGIWTSDTLSARRILLEHVPFESEEVEATNRLSAEGFGCQPSSMTFSKGINCQLLVPGRVGYTRWIIDLDFNEARHLRDVKVQAWNIFL